MDEMQQAHHELDRIQGIITRHEGHLITLRGWLLAIIGGLLAAYYTANIDMSALMLRAALLLITLLSLFVESRYVNLIEAVVERAEVIERGIRDARAGNGEPAVGWYDGPRVCAVCGEGVSRWWPRSGMTFVLNQPFYVVVILIVVLTTVSLPARQDAAATHVVPEQVTQP